MDNEGLEGPFLEDEVAKALSELGGDKALGLDGFSMALWKFCWPIVEVLANRLKRVIDKMVSNNQNAFVRARQILDATLVTNEEIDLRK
ncbi:hypothetical protein AAG906_020778 [Vitis piasezkii]